MIKTYKQYNESVKDLLKGKSDEDVKKGLEGLSDLDKISTISRYNINQKFLPSDENIKKILSKFKLFDILFFVKGNNLPIRFMPSDEEIEKELDKLTYKKRIDTIERFKLSDKFLPKRAKTQRLQTIQKIREIIKQRGSFNNFKSTYILDRFIWWDNNYDALLLAEIGYNGIVCYGYINQIDNKIKYKYDDLDYFTVNFIMKVLKNQIKEGRF